jgi:hypothetical protein
MRLDVDKRPKRGAAAMPSGGGQCGGFGGTAHLALLPLFPDYQPPIDTCHACVQEAQVAQGCAAHAIPS